MSAPPPARSSVIIEVWIQIAPLAVAIGLLAAGRGALLAGAAGLFVTAAAALATSPLGPEALAGEAVRGAWLAWHAIAVMAAGMFFQRSLEPMRATPPASAGNNGSTDRPGGFDYRSAYSACFLVGPFTESATGFGVGYVIALSLLLRMGVPALAAAVLGLFSQILVPWGALAVGTRIGAHLTGLPEESLSAGSALLTVPLLFGHLATFWWLLRRFSLPVPRRAAVEDVAWTAAMAALLFLTARIAAVEIVVIATLGPLLALRYLRDARPTRSRLIDDIRANLGYVALTAALLATRLIPGLDAALWSGPVLRPFEGELPFPVLMNPSFWLLLVPLVLLLVQGRPGRILPALKATARFAWKPSLVTLFFVVMARLFAGSGMAGNLATSLHGAVGTFAVVATPSFAGLAGFLTGSNTGSNGLMMPIQAALAARVAVDAVLMAAVQNTIGSAFTMLSPIRISLGCALVASPGLEGEVYRQGAVIGGMVLTIGTALVALVLALG